MGRTEDDTAAPRPEAKALAGEGRTEVLAPGTGDAERRWSTWMVRAQGGDADSYRRLLTEIGGVIEAYLKRRFGHREWVADCVQESLLAMHRARHTYDPGRRLWPWMVTIVKHKAVDMLRRDAVRARTEVGSADAPGSCATGSGLEHDSALDAARLLGLLKPEYRQALILTKLEGRSIDEAAVTMGISPSAMKTRVHRAIRLVQRMLESEPI